MICKILNRANKRLAKQHEEIEELQMQNDTIRGCNRFLIDQRNQVQTALIEENVKLKGEVRRLEQVLLRKNIEAEEARLGDKSNAHRRRLIFQNCDLRKALKEVLGCATIPCEASPYASLWGHAVAHLSEVDRVARDALALDKEAE